MLKRNTLRAPSCGVLRVDILCAKASFLAVAHVTPIAPTANADIAVVLRGRHGNRAAAALDMAGIAFDVLLETGVLVEALPLWEDELRHPERFSNPALIESIRREGMRL